ncbi:MAG: hypothetical protein ABF785_10590 [Acetobacter papayae]|uniref:hypothetical protein n=2 Tax=Acetobacter papayae TaxID=1076592 RepID=UPI0039ED8D27
MTLAAVLAALLALGVVARGMGFLPALGLVGAVAMLVSGQPPLSQVGAVLAVVLGVAPGLFLSRYQADSTPEGRQAALPPFLALALMVLLLLAGSRVQAGQFPAGLCVGVAGLVSVACRRGMVWQWAGLLTCAQGVLLSAVMAGRVMAFGAGALGGLVMLVLGALCAHRLLPRRARSLSGGEKTQ